MRPCGRMCSVLIGDSPDDFQNFPPAHRFDTCDIVSDLVQRLRATISQESFFRKKNLAQLKGYAKLSGLWDGAPRTITNGAIAHVRKKSKCSGRFSKSRPEEQDPGHRLPGERCQTARHHYVVRQLLCVAAARRAQPIGLQARNLHCDARPSYPTFRAA